MKNEDFILRLMFDDGERVVVLFLLFCGIVGG